MVQNFIEAESRGLLIILGCLIVSAFFSSSETAITSLGILKVKHLIEQKGRSVRHLKLWIDRPGHIITTILVFNNIVNLLASSVATQMTYKYFANAAVGIATGAITFLVLVFGEIIPKSFAKTHSEPFAIISMRLIVAIYYVTYPIINIFMK